MATTAVTDVEPESRLPSFLSVAVAAARRYLLATTSTAPTSPWSAYGGWGELPLSYEDPARRGEDPPTPSQTAWAVVEIAACGRVGTLPVERGIDYLLARQRADGSWRGDYWAGTGFAKVFYLRYHLYAAHFALRAFAVLQCGRAALQEDCEARL